MPFHRNAILAGLLTTLSLASTPAAAQAGASCPGGAAFSWRLFRAISGRHPTTNIAISPASVAEALGMVQAGSAGDTRRALDCAIGPAGARRAVARTDSGITLAVANSVWLRLGLEASPVWLSTLKQSFRAEVASLNLRSNAAVERMNTWASLATRGKIPTILSDLPDESTQIILLNAVYFKGKWAEEFDSARTRPDSFSLLNGKKARVQMMSRLGEYRYAHVGGVQLIRLPYRGDRYAFYVALPDSGRSVTELERMLDAMRWRSLQDSLAMQQVDFRMPRFLLTAEEDLKPPLTALQLGIMFEAGRADLTPMFARLPAGPPPVVGSAFQKVFIEVNEEGTEAAAITAMGIVPGMARSLPPRMLVNRPFLFVLQDDSAHSILFAGRVVQP